MNSCNFLLSILAGLIISTGCAAGNEAAGRPAGYESGEDITKASVNVLPKASESPDAEESINTKETTEAFETETGASETETSADGPLQAETAAAPVPEPSEIVLVKKYIPDIKVDLKYASDNNFTGQTIYDFTDAYLRYGTVLKLKAAQEKAGEHGMTLLIWDAFRPVSAQFRLWEVCPDSTYVANPNQGFSSHSRGNTVDVSMVAADGRKIEMPTGFDDFSALADRDYSDCSEAAAGNARLLEQIMTEAGFKPYFGEWWHFSDTESYPVEKEMFSTQQQNIFHFLVSAY